MAPSGFFVDILSQMYFLYFTNISNFFFQSNIKKKKFKRFEPDHPLGLFNQVICKKPHLSLSCLETEHKETDNASEKI